VPPIVPIRPAVIVAVRDSCAFPLLAFLKRTRTKAASVALAVAARAIVESEVVPVVPDKLATVLPTVTEESAPLTAFALVANAGTTMLILLVKSLAAL